jgi:hypothetical protein
MGSQGIVMVLANHEPKLFVPDVYTRTPTWQKKKVGALPVTMPPPTNLLREWIRTRNGYVEGKGLLFDELKRKSAGGFAKPAL